MLRRSGRRHSDRKWREEKNGGDGDEDGTGEGRAEGDAGEEEGGTEKEAGGESERGGGGIAHSPEIHQNALTNR